MIGDGRSCIDTDAVKAEFHEPVKYVVNEEIGNLRFCERYSDAPARIVLVIEKRFCIFMQKVTVRAKMVINHVKDDHQPFLMCRIDKPLQAIRFTIGTAWRIRQYAVIAPVARTPKAVDRHDFYGSNSQRLEFIEALGHSIKTTEQSGM